MRAKQAGNIEPADRRREGRDARVVARAYLASPEEFGANSRQAAKVHRAVRESAKLLDISRERAVERVLDTAAQRLARARPTVYLQNMGSSGSHWLSALLEHAFGTLSSGEVYFPANLRKEVSLVQPPEEQPLIFQAIMMAHALTGTKRDARASIVNSAHVREIGTYRKLDIASRTVLLLRHPVDVVLSRTFRKDEYRSYLGHGAMSDTAYALRNIEFVESFLGRALEGAVDATIKYEDLVVDPASALRKLAGRLGWSVHEPQLAAAIKQTQLTRDGTGVPTNAFQGDQPKISKELRLMTERRLASMIMRAGYPIELSDK